MQNLEIGKRYIVTNWSEMNPRQKMYVWISDITDTHISAFANSIAARVVGGTGSCTWPIAITATWKWEAQ